MRSGGHRIAGTDPNLRKHVYGWLHYRRTPTDDYGKRWEAHLLDKQGGKGLILPLYRARLSQIDGVCHIVGTEEGGRTNTKAKPSLWKQSWLCAIDPSHALPLLDKVCLDPGDPYSRELDNLIEDPYEPYRYA